jgi:hypothetical protein
MSFNAWRGQIATAASTSSRSASSGSSISSQLVVVVDAEHPRRDLRAAGVPFAQVAIDDDPHHHDIHLPIGVPHTQRMIFCKTFSFSGVYGYQTCSSLVPKRSITIGSAWQ